MCLKGLNLVGILVITATLIFGVHARAAVIILNSQGGAKGDSVTYHVFVDTAPNDASALGFEVRYDPKILRFRDYSSGPLVSGFDFFAANNSSPGTVKVGGFSAGDGRIFREDSGSMISLTFDVIGHDDCRVWFAQLKDDIETWSTQSGRFIGDHAVEQEFADDLESPTADSSIRNPENDTDNNISDDFDKPVYSNTPMAESNPAFSREDFRTAATESVRARPNAEKPREAGISRQKRKKAKLKEKQEIIVAGGASPKPNQTPTEVDKSLANTHTGPRVIPLKNLYSEKAQTNGSYVLIGMMMFYALIYYLTIGCAIVVAGYISWELVQIARRHLSEA